MNRDELRTRGPEVPPEVRSASGTAWIGPLDSDAGGTWIGTNEYGVTACLLNAYFPVGAAPEAIQQGARSRGVIIPELLAHTSRRECEAWLYDALDPKQYAGFMLLLVTADACTQFLWRGHGALQAIPHENEWTCLTSSFIDASDAELWRYAAFRAWLANGAEERARLPLFHLQREPGRESLSTLMERDYSITRSITQVEADADTTRVRYWPEPRPDTDPDAPEADLPLPRSAARAAQR
jgi:hypothetical protein